MYSVKESDLTFEFIESANLNIYQPKNGYRYGEEAINLSNFAKTDKNEFVIDLGAGCGIIGLMIANRDHPKEVVLIEQQKSLAEIIQFNIDKNKIENAICLNADYRELALNNVDKFDLAVCNPPFTPVDKGRTSKDPQKAMARIEISSSLKETVLSAHTMIKSSGKFWIVLPEERDVEMKHLTKGIFQINQIQNINHLNYYCLIKI